MNIRQRVTRRALARGAAGAIGAIAAAPLLGGRGALAADQVLTIAIPNNPGTLDPMNQINHDAMAATHLIFENLMVTDVDGEIRPQLAAAPPKISDDKLSYTFELRDNVRFHSGDKLTADDVKYSYEYILDPKNKGLRRGVWTPIREITVESPTRVRFDLREPYRPLLAYMTKFMGVFPKGSREKYGDDHFRLAPKGVGTGPGVFVEWRQNDYIELQRNPDYWEKGVPAWDRVMIRTVPEDAVRVAYLLTNQAQIISAPAPKDLARLKTMRGIAGDTKPGLGLMLSVLLNTKKPPLDDVDFRQAIAHAIDRDLIAKNVFYGMLDPSGAAAPAKSWWHSKDAAESQRYDKEKARALLAKSKHANAAEFDMNVPAQPYLFDVRDAAVVIQSQLADIGVKVNLKFLDLAQVAGASIAGTHTAGLFPNMGPIDPTYLIQAFYLPDQVQSKSSGYTNDALTAAVKESFRYNTREELKPIYDKIQAIIAADAPGVWLGYLEIANLWRGEVKDFKVNSGLTMLARDVKLA